MPILRPPRWRPVSRGERLAGGRGRRFLIGEIDAGISLGDHRLAPMKKGWS